MQDAIQAQLVIQKMSELSTQESSDDLDPISESPSKTLDEDEHESSSENDETLEEDEEKENNEQTLDTANANLDFRSTDMENNIPVSIFFFRNCVYTKRNVVFCFPDLLLNNTILKSCSIEKLEVCIQKAI